MELDRKKGGAERTRRRRYEAEKESGWSATGFLYDGDSADDELSKLMPSLQRQFEVFDDDEGTLNFMGEINMAKEERLCHKVDKENVVSDRNSFRQPKRRRGSGVVTTSRPIDFNKLLASNNIMVPSPSSNLYKNITTVLKENVDRAANQSQILDDFWSTETQKKISAVARRKLTGIKTPPQTKPKVVEDRNARHARSRRGGGSRRPLGKRPIKLDFCLDAAKISEWDQETLAEEEVPQSTRPSSGVFMSAGRPSATLAEEEVPQSTRPSPGVFMSAGRPSAPLAEEELPPSTLASSSAVVSTGRPTTDSPCSLPDMELSPGQSPLVEVQELAERVEHAQAPLQDPDSAHACTPVPENNLQIQRFPLTSPTPPSNPVAVYMSLRHMEGDIGQRTLSFLSSPSLETIDTGGYQDMDEVQEDISILVEDDSLAVNDSPAAKELFTDDSMIDPRARSEAPEDEKPVKEQPAPVKLKTPQGQQADTGRPLPRSLDAVSSSLSLIGDTLGTQIEERFRLSDGLSSPEVSKSLHRSSSIGEKVEDVQARQLALTTEDSAPGDGELKASRAVVIGILSREENALLTLSQDYPDDDEVLEVPDVKDTEPFHYKYNCSSLGERTEQNRLQHNQEGSLRETPIENGNEAQILPEELHETEDSEVAPPCVDAHKSNAPTEESVSEIPIENRNEAQILAEELHETGDSEAALPCVDTHKSNAPTEGATWTDEGSTTLTKPKSKKPRAKKVENKRNSLEDCGTIWKEGHRRSQRIRVRPLEWWRGEKLLYGRVHDSLATVIGIKHSSPGKYDRGIEEPFIVESYVPAQYHDLVQWAAL